VLLKNAARLLPLSGKEKLDVAGSNADDIGNQAGGWTVAWQGLSGDIIPATPSLRASARSRRLRGLCRLRPAAGPHRPARLDRRARGVVVPGSQGEGVADVPLGRQEFTGRR
jgi:hypothetical protein